MDGKVVGGERVAQEGEDIHIHIHFLVQQKLMWHCKAIRTQLKKIKESIVCLYNAANKWKVKQKKIPFTIISPKLNTYVKI